MPDKLEVQIREGSNSGTIISITLKPKNIVATTGATSTTFVFDSPIYVQKDQEFCIVLASNSAFSISYSVSSIGVTSYITHHF